MHRVRASCRGCGESELEHFLSLGQQPLANAFLRRAEDALDEPRFPLDVHLCTTCSLVQLTDVISPEALFSEYIYLSGTSSTMAAHAARFAHEVSHTLELNDGDLVVEVASNDGSLLSHFKARGLRVLGVEPARNVAAVAENRGIPTENRFFGRDVATALRAVHGPARVVVANQVLARVDDTLGFLEGCAALIDDGSVVLEVPYARAMLDGTEYDTIYHEHLCYFSVTSLAHVAARAGLGILRAEEVAVHGGSLRVWLRKGTSHGEQALAMMRSEQQHGVHALDTWRAFAGRVRENRRALRMLLEQLHARGKVVVGYGAPAKSTTLLNCCGIDTTLLPFTVDRNPLKIGTLTPGMHVPVLDARALVTGAPDYVLVLAWNLADEIMEEQRAHRDRGGWFIVPVPTPRIF
ncbi:MAG: class I SAM-dependent methyltransferase [Gemmatimonadaceae bacterium]